MKGGKWQGEQQFGTRILMRAIAQSGAAFLIIPYYNDAPPAGSHLRHLCHLFRGDPVGLQSIPLHQERVIRASKEGLETQPLNETTIFGH
jgi:hypothetical protein